MDKLIIRFFTREHCELLSDSLKTQVYITQKQFNDLLETNLYRFYCYDGRVFQLLFILNDIENNYKNYTTWIGIEIKSLDIKK